MQAANDRRTDDDDRVPLDALIELTHAEGSEVLEADAVDMSSGGLSLRASFMPPVGARMQCSFACPPHGDRVVADCEVVWSAWEGPQAGAFGVRFLALDTRSAKLIRRVLEPQGPHVQSVPDAPPDPEPARAPSVASLHIAGLGAPIEADLHLNDDDHVLVTQELDFLRLGRGVRVEIEGTPARQGRIASVKLEQGQGDVPALSLGILIDAADLVGLRAVPPAPEPQNVRDAAARVFGAGAAAPQPVSTQSRVERSLDLGPSDTWPESPLFAAAAMAADTADAAVEHVADSSEPDAMVDAAQPATGGEPSGQPEELRSGGESPWTHVEREPTSARQPASPDQEGLASPDQEGLAPLPEDDLTPALTAFAAMTSKLSSAGARDTYTTLQAWRALQWGRLRQALGERAPGYRDWLGGLWLILQRWVSSQSAKLKHFKRTQKKRRTTAPAPRTGVRRTAGVEPRRASRPEPARGGRMLLVGVLAFGGVAGAIYALAPRRGPEAIDLHRAVVPRMAQPAQEQPVTATPVPQPSFDTPVPPAVIEEAPSEPHVEEGLQFGAAQVPNGRTYSLRMSGPIERIEGEERSGGFVVRVPGRLSLDRASPIATSHPALSRSLVLNQGDRAELTIEFVRGKQPKYRVEAKGNTLEVTVQRL